MAGLLLSKLRLGVVAILPVVFVAAGLNLIPVDLGWAGLTQPGTSSTGNALFLSGLAVIGSLARPEPRATLVSGGVSFCALRIGLEVRGSNSGVGVTQLWDGGWHRGVQFAHPEFQGPHPILGLSVPILVTVVILGIISVVLSRRLPSMAAAPLVLIGLLLVATVTNVLSQPGTLPY